ncbi:MAG: ABC transporter substrate-binding protein, partial [Actinomycetota bacterium]
MRHHRITGVRCVVPTVGRLTVAGAMVFAVLAGTVVPATAQPVASAQAGPARTADAVVSAYYGKRWFLGRLPRSAVTADPTRPAIKIGLINQEETPLGSYPEVRVAIQAAAAWVNAELGGVDGRPVEIVPCITRFDPQQSRACAERLADEGVVAFVGGVDVMSNASIPVVEQRGLVLIGGIPATLAEQRSPAAFAFSGGDPGALAAFMADADRAGARRVVLAYGAEVDSFAVAANDYGAAVGRSLGLQVDVVPYPILTSDFGPLMRDTEDRGADAVMVLAATSACVPVMRAARAARLEARLYLTGACAADDIVAAAGPAARGVVFNAEGRVDGASTDAALYADVVDRYATAPAGGAGTVGFRGFMNLYALAREAGGANVTSARLAALARAAAGRRSFWGHPYTCDGRQVPGLPALCAPQQVLFERTADGKITARTGWIATDRLFAGARPAARDLVGRWAHYDVVAYEDGTLKTLIVSYG